MSTAALVSELRRHRVKLWLHNGQMCLRGQAGVLSAKQKEQIWAADIEALSALLRADDRGRPIGATLFDEPKAGSTGNATLRRTRLSVGQKALWQSHQAAPTWMTNVPSIFRMLEQLNIEDLRKTFTEIFRRHEILRSQVEIYQGETVLAVKDVGNFQLGFMDLSRFPETRQEEAMRKASEFARAPFNLTIELPARVLLLKLSDTEHVMLLVLHAMISDNESFGILHREIGAFYTAFTLGESPSLTDPVAQYSDHAEWEREFLQSELGQEHLDYWKEQLEGARALELQDETVVPESTPRILQSLEYEFPASLVFALRELNRREGMTLFMVLLAAFKVLLSSWSGQNDVVVGCVGDTRLERSLHNVVGPFVNVYPLRTDLAGDPTFRQLLRRVRNMHLDALENNIPIPSEHSKLLNVIVDYRISCITLASTFGPAGPMPKIEPFRLDPEPFHFTADLRIPQLQLAIWDEPDKINGRILFNPLILHIETVKKMSNTLRELLEEVSVHPESRLSMLPGLRKTLKQ
jgi:hypothetical protein